MHQGGADLDLVLVLPVAGRTVQVQDQRDLRDRIPLRIHLQEVEVEVGRQNDHEGRNESDSIIIILK